MAASQASIVNLATTVLLAVCDRTVAIISPPQFEYKFLVRIRAAIFIVVGITLPVSLEPTARKTMRFLFGRAIPGNANSSNHAHVIAATCASRLPPYRLSVVRALRLRLASAPPRFHAGQTVFPVFLPPRCVFCAKTNEGQSDERA